MAAMVTADEAAHRLGISKATLYAYVSRGLLTAHPSKDGRSSLYSAAAVDRLAAERRRGRRPKEVARSAIDWGVPVLESRLTLITGGRLYYRGQDAAKLAEDATLEHVAALLWGAPEADVFTGEPPELAPAFAALLDLGEAAPAHETLLHYFVAASQDEPTAAWRTDPARLLPACAALVRLMTAAAVRGKPGAQPVHERLARAWGQGAEGANLIRRALVLCADHELNASGFTARCVASTGASVRAAVAGGLAALSGPKHGFMTFRVEHFWNGLRAESIAGDLRERLASGGTLPGFRHQLYPEGDIRAQTLLAPILPQSAEIRNVLAGVEDLVGERPSIDFALVALRRFLNLPEGAAFLIFALGRTVGWIAQALEQRADGHLIRPRAVYIGEPPESSA